MPLCLFTDRAVIAIKGPEAGAFLDNLLTVNVSDLPEGAARFGALLSPQGKILVDMVIVRQSGDFLIDCPRMLAPDLVRRLTLYRLRAKIDFIDHSSDTVVVAGWNEAPALSAFTDPRLEALGWRALCPTDHTPPSPAPREAYDRHRILLGVPEGGRDFTYGDSFPHETLMDCLKGIDFKKGCYVGQEVVSRMQHRATARTRVMPITFLDHKAPPEGSQAFAGERAIGAIGSVTADGHGLALLRLDRVADAEAAHQSLHSAGLAFRVEKRDFMTFPWPQPTESATNG